MKYLNSAVLFSYLCDLRHFFWTYTEQSISQQRFQIWHFRHLLVPVTHDGCIWYIVLPGVFGAGSSVVRSGLELEALTDVISLHFNRLILLCTLSGQANLYKEQVLR